MTSQTTMSCPSCGRPLPEHGGYPRWCDGCNWNIVAEPPASTRPGIGGRLYAAAGRRLGARLAGELAKPEALEPRLTPTRLATYAVAGLVFALTIALGAAGIAGVVVGVDSGNVVLIVGGLVLSGVAWYMRPRPGRAPRAGVVARPEAPALYELVDQVAASVGVRSVHRVVVDGSWNATWEIVGFRRTRVLTLGLPLLHALDRQQRVALIGHELAHARNGDSTRGLFVGSSIRGLAELYSFLDPSGPEDSEGIAMLAKPILWLVSRPPYLLLHLQVNLAQHDSHRAEYLADFLAARVAGTKAVVGLHERILFGSTFALAAQRAAASKSASDSDLFDELEARMRETPPHEIERRRRVARLTASRLDETHPPTGMRIELLELRPDEPGVVHLSEDGARAIHDELRPPRRALHEQLVAEFQSSLYFS